MAMVCLAYLSIFRHIARRPCWQFCLDCMGSGSMKIAGCRFWRGRNERCAMPLGPREVFCEKWLSETRYHLQGRVVVVACCSYFLSCDEPRYGQGKESHGLHSEGCAAVF